MCRKYLSVCVLSVMMVFGVAMQAQAGATRTDPCAPVNNKIVVSTNGACTNPIINGWNGTALNPLLVEFMPGNYSHMRVTNSNYVHVSAVGGANVTRIFGSQWVVVIENSSNVTVSGFNISSDGGAYGVLARYNAGYLKFINNVFENYILEALRLGNGFGDVQLNDVEINGCTFSGNQNALAVYSVRSLKIGSSTFRNNGMDVNTNNIVTPQIKLSTIDTVSGSWEKRLVNEKSNGILW